MRASEPTRGAQGVPVYPAGAGAVYRAGVGAVGLPRWAVVVSAAVAALIVWLIAVPVLGVDLRVMASPGAIAQEVGPVAVVLASLVGGLAAWGVRAFLNRLRSKSNVAWWVTSGISLLVSLLGPLGAVSTGATVALMAMHVVVGGTLMVGLRR